MLGLNIRGFHFDLEKGSQVGKISAFAFPEGKSRDRRCSRFEVGKSFWNAIYRDGWTVLVKKNGGRMMEGKQ